MNATPEQWNEVARLWIGGEPAPQPRPRARIIPPAFNDELLAGLSIQPAVAKELYKRIVDRTHAQIYNPGSADEWKAVVKKSVGSIAPRQPLEGPIKVDITFLMPRPKYLYESKYPAGPILYARSPDRDNLDKSTLDAMTDAGVWNDDGQVCRGAAEKFYHAKSGGPGCILTVSSLVAAHVQTGLFQEAAK